MNDYSSEYTHMSSFRLQVLIPPGLETRIRKAAHHVIRASQQVPALGIVGIRLEPGRQAIPMTAESVKMKRRKRIALIAHDNRKTDILDWAHYNRGTLSQHELFATGTTGALAGMTCARSHFVIRGASYVSFCSSFFRSVRFACRVAGPCRRAGRKSRRDRSSAKPLSHLDSRVERRKRS